MLRDVALFWLPLPKFQAPVALQWLVSEAGSVPSQQHTPGAGEHKRMEISTVFASAVAVMMTIHCCRCVHVE